MPIADISYGVIYAIILVMELIMFYMGMKMAKSKNLWFENEFWEKGE